MITNVCIAIYVQVMRKIIIDLVIYIPRGRQEVSYLLSY